MTNKTKRSVLFTVLEYTIAVRIFIGLREKGRDLTQSYDKKPYTSMSKGQSDNTNNSTKSSIPQLLRTDLGRSFGVTTTTQLVWLTGLRAQHSHSPQQPCIQKDTHLKNVNKPPYIDKPTFNPSGEVNIGVIYACPHRYKCCINLKKRSLFVLFAKYFTV